MATYTIPLRSEVIKTQKYKRAKRAVRTVQSFIEKHQKTTKVKLENELNIELWKHGIRNFPKSIKVQTEKGKKGVVTVQMFGVKKKEKKEKPKKEKSGTFKNKLEEKVQGKSKKTEKVENKT